MKFIKIFFTCVLLMLNTLAAAHYYGGNEMAKVLAEFTKKWNLGVMATGESHPNEHLDYLHLAFTSNAMVPPYEARDLLIACEKELLAKLNQCPKLKNRLKNKYFKFENLEVSIAFADKKHQLYPANYAGFAFLSTKGITIYSEDERGHSIVIFRENVPSEFCEEYCQTFQVEQ